MFQNSVIVIVQVIGLVVLKPLATVCFGAVGVALCVGLSYVVDVVLLCGWQVCQVVHIDYRRRYGVPMIAGCGATVCVLMVLLVLCQSIPLVVLLYGSLMLLGICGGLLALTGGRLLVF